MHITGIPVSSAFDTIIRKDLIEIMENILSEDEARLARLFLSNTSLDIKIKGVETESSHSNRVLPQGDSISGTFFNIYLEDNLRCARCEFNLKKPAIEQS